MTINRVKSSSNNNNSQLTSKISNKIYIDIHPSGIIKLTKRFNRTEYTAIDVSIEMLSFNGRNEVYCYLFSYFMRIHIIHSSLTMNDVKEGEEIRRDFPFLRAK